MRCMLDNIVSKSGFGSSVGSCSTEWLGGVCVVVFLAGLSFTLLGCQTQVGSDHAGYGESTIGAEAQGNQAEASLAEPRRVGGILLETLRKAKLELAWRSSLPMGRAQQLKEIFYHNERLYALNDHNRLYALDGTKGTILWTVENLSSAHSSHLPVAYYQDTMLLVFGNTLYQIHERDGRVWPEGCLEFDFPVATNVARSGERLFVGSRNNRFYCLRVGDMVPLWQSACPAPPTGTVAVDGDKVYFVCEDGVLYVSPLEERSLAWHKRTAGQVCGVVVDGGQCYLPSSDTALYCLDPNTGTALWPAHLAGGSLVELPTLTAESVYQPVRYGPLLCIDRQNGSLRWELKNGRSMLAENGRTTYALTWDKELVLMDNVSGSRMMSFYVPEMDLHVRNKDDQMIFLASEEGTILALKPCRD